MCQPRKTKEDAIQNIREAIEGYVLALQEDGLAVPPDHFDAVLVAVCPNCLESRGVLRSSASQIRISNQTATRQPHHS
jgi:hypothetical protein